MAGSPAALPGAGAAELLSLPSSWLPKEMEEVGGGGCEGRGFRLVFKPLCEERCRLSSLPCGPEQTLWVSYSQAERDLEVSL